MEVNLPQVVSRHRWLEARKELLTKEKELTRARDRLNADRRRLPMVEVEKDYAFTGPGGSATLADLFAGRRQLIIQHFMFDPEWEQGCPSCSAWTDHICRGHLTHLHARNTTFAVVSRAPLGKIAAFKARMGWPVPWYSSYGSDFNYDFHVTLDESVMPIEYNYRSKAELKDAGSWPFTDEDQPIELPGTSCFLLNDGKVFHTYSTYARGLEQAGGAYYMLDWTVLGRQESWEEPKGRVTYSEPQAGSPQMRYPDEYPEWRES